MNLGGDRYQKLQLRDEKSRRWAKMRLETRSAPSTPAGTGAGTEEEKGRGVATTGAAAEEQSDAAEQSARPKSAQ